MTIERTRIIDHMGIEKDTDDVVLAVVDDLDWSDELEHLRLLQEKLNSYLAFIESGEVIESFKEHTGRTLPLDVPVKVQILAKFDPTPRALEFLRHATATFAGAGFELTYRVVRL